MKQPYPVLLFCVLTLFSLQLNTQSTYQDKEGNTQLLGPVTISQLQVEPFNTWLEPGMEEYAAELSADIAKGLSDTKVKIFMATWCGDTKNYLPKFIKLWKQADLSEDQLEIVALHLDGDEYKRSPSRIEEQYNIHRVPTFIFEKEGEEIGRIVERPLNDLVTDIAQITHGIPSLARYRAVSMIHGYYLSEPQDSLYTHLGPMLRKMYRHVSGPGELNTYGYVLMAAGRYQEAELAFVANTRMFRFNPFIQDSLGELYMKLERYPEAKECFQKVLDIKKEDERASDFLSEIKEKLEK